ncbi:MAG: hypothetical protein WCK28_07400 [Burkholderiales bacterium]|jgi:hypothetical protein
MHDAHTEHYLLPSASLQSFIDHAERVADDADRDALIDAWRAAADTMARIEDAEAGCADEPGILEIPDAMADHVDAFVGVPEVNRAFSRVPVSFGLIEIDATMTARGTLREATLEACRRRWPADLDDPALVAACLPVEPPARHDVRARFEHGAMTLLAEDPALRFLGARLRVGDEAAALEAGGTVDAGLELSFGRGPSVLHAVRHAGRLLLVDGHHRARVLRALGQTFLPCVISACADLDDVRAAAPELAGIDLDRFFEAPRPPLLRDFDRPALVHTHRVRATRRLLRVRVTVEEDRLP